MVKVGTEVNGYVVQTRLGRGAQGSVFLCNKKTNPEETKVLKVISCHDEDEVNAALGEFAVISGLTHDCICNVLDVFVHWNKQEQESMKICIIMDYYPKGDLSEVLRRKRESETAWSEEELLKMLGQLIVPLRFVHEKRIIHRDIKPANILIGDDNRLILCDFGVATKTAVGQAAEGFAGTVTYMAPELLVRAYDQRSDVWSVGCILLEMACVSLHGKQPMPIINLLRDLKKHPWKLESQLDRLRDELHYSAHFLHCLRLMLRLNFEQRPTLTELCVVPFVRHLLEGGDAMRPPTAAPGSTIPAEASLMELMQIAKENLKDKALQRSVLDAISKRLDAKETPSPTLWKVIIVSTLTHKQDEAIYIKSCQCISKLIDLISETNSDDPENCPGKNGLFSISAVMPMIMGMRIFPGSVRCQIEGCQVLWRFATREAGLKIVGSHGGIQDVMGALRTHKQDPELMKIGMGTLWNLAQSDRNIGIMVVERHITFHLSMLSSITDAAAAESVLQLICSLLTEEENTFALVACTDSVAKLVAWVFTFQDNTKITGYWFSALSQFMLEDVFVIKFVEAVKDDLNAFIQIVTTCSSTDDSIFGVALVSVMGILMGGEKNDVSGALISNELVKGALGAVIARFAEDQEMIEAAQSVSLT